MRYPKDTYGWELRPKRILFLIGVWWRSGRKWYVYDWNFITNRNPWHKLWHRSKLLRDYGVWKYDRKLRKVARFIVSTKMFWNDSDRKRWESLTGLDHTVVIEHPVVAEYFLPGGEHYIDYDPAR